MQIIKENRSVPQSSSKEAYVKPETEVVKLELEQPILTGSGNNFGNGGRW